MVNVGRPSVEFECKHCEVYSAALHIGFACRPTSIHKMISLDNVESLLQQTAAEVSISQMIHVNVNM